VPLPAQSGATIAQDPLIGNPNTAFCPYFFALNEKGARPTVLTRTQKRPVYLV
jgi:hypothetical protein